MKFVLNSCFRNSGVREKEKKKIRPLIAFVRQEMEKISPPKSASFMGRIDFVYIFERMF